MISVTTDPAETEGIDEDIGGEEWVGYGPAGALMAGAAIAMAPRDDVLTSDDDVLEAPNVGVVESDADMFTPIHTIGNRFTADNLCLS